MKIILRKILSLTISGRLFFAKDLRFAQGCYSEIRRPLLCFKIETRRHISFKDGVKLPQLEARIFSLAPTFDFWKILFDIAKKPIEINHFCKSHINSKTQGHNWSSFRKIRLIFMVSLAKKPSKTQFWKRPKNGPKMMIKPLKSHLESLFCS